jgi:hypothetical protein
MTSDRKIAANRNNGRRSSGPRTAAGKASSRRNALRHGLAVSILDEPAMCAEVETLAHAIAGNGADDFQLSQARIIAAAQLDLVRIQGAKVTLMNSHIAATMPSRAGTPRHDATLHSPSGDASLEFGSDDPACETEFARELAMVPTIEVLQELAKRDRYEGRAISRRGRAMRAFLAYQGI